MTGTDHSEIDRSYSDNEEITMAARLVAEIADGAPERLDVASGYLAVSVWDTVGDALRELSAFRLLIGKDWELVRTREDEEADIAHLVSQAVLDESQPPRLPVPADAAAVAGFIAFLERESSEVKVWRGDGFLHAKAYIFDASVGVGSANFTGAGFTRNRELVMWRQDRAAVREVKDWFRRFWESPASVDYKQDLLDALRATRFGGFEYTPYQVLIRVLADRYGLDKPPSLEHATFTLKWFQTDAVMRLVRLLSSPARGALLADAVGLGKTFMALGVIHHFLHQRRESVRGRPVTLIIPASLRRTWEQVLDRYNLAWAVHIVHVQELRNDFDVTDVSGADLVVIDEAHRLRGGGTWFHKTVELLRDAVAKGGDPRVLLLSATPVNTSMRDLTNLLRVATKNRRNVWAPEIPDFERYLKRVERDNLDPYPLLDRSVVRRSRSDIVTAYEQRRLTDPFTEPISLQKRRLGHVPYRYDTSDDGDDTVSVFDVFANVVENLYLAPYDLERFRRDRLEEDGDEVEASSLAGLYVTGLLKRFESSLAAVEISLRRLDRVLELFSDGLAMDPPRLLSIADNVDLRRLIEAEARDDIDDDVDVDAVYATLLTASERLPDVAAYDLERVAEAVTSDRAGVQALLSVLPDRDADGKYQALVDVLTRSMAGTKIGMRDRRLLLFTQFRDTAIYLGERLTADATTNPLLGNVVVLHGGSNTDQRAQVAATFDPDQIGGLTSAAAGNEPPRVLVATDVLSEGHNLQLAEGVINYDLHWNPQVAVQRAGRVDRLNSPHGTVYLLSFLPEDNLDRILGLVDKLNGRFRLYKQLGLADEPVTNLPADQVVSKSLEQLRRIYRDDNDILDEIEKTWTFGSTDYMRAPLEAFLRANAADALKTIPVGVQSVKHAPADWRHGPGVFIAFTVGNNDERETYWRFYPRTDSGWGPPLRDDIDLFRLIHCQPTEPRAPQPPSLTFDGPGGIIDWQLLHTAARDLADEITAARNTASLTRGASERSANLRIRIIDAYGGHDVDEIESLLDRLEQVRVEDYDAASGYETFMERLRNAERANTPVDRQHALEALAETGLDLFGEPVNPTLDAATVEVQPDDLQLTAWETIVDQVAVSSSLTQLDLLETAAVPNPE